MTNPNENKDLLADSLNEIELELLLLLLDGELEADPAQKHAADELLAQSEVARVLAQDWRNAKLALREGILQGPPKLLPQTEIDLSLLHGRVMSKLLKQIRSKSRTWPPRRSRSRAVCGLGFSILALAKPVLPSARRSPSPCSC